MTTMDSTDLADGGLAQAVSSDQTTASPSRTAAFGRVSEPFRHMRIVIVDDVPLNVRLVEAHLRDAGYRNLATETDPSRVLAELYREPPSLVLLDLMMPGISGLDILEAIRADRRWRHLPVLILTASTDRAHRLEALQRGATDFLNKPVDVQELLPRVHNALEVKRHQDHLEEEVAERTRELRRAHREVVECLARAGEYRDNDTGRHVMRVRMYVAAIARSLGLDARTAELVADASMLHDVGKIGISDTVLLKPGRLTDEEMELMRKHCEFGWAICSGISHDEASQANAFLSTFSSPILRTAATIAATHHEKWDGSGYPKGLQGTDIPLEGRITAVADVFDALTSTRPYKDAFPLEKCLAIIREGRGSHFDPRVVDAFFDVLDEIERIRVEYSDDAMEQTRSGSEN